MLKHYGADLDFHNCIAMTDLCPPAKLQGKDHSSGVFLLSQSHYNDNQNNDNQNADDQSHNVLLPGEFFRIDVASPERAIRERPCPRQECAIRGAESMSKPGSDLKTKSNKHAREDLRIWRGQGFNLTQENNTGAAGVQEKPAAETVKYESYVKCDGLMLWLPPFPARFFIHFPLNKQAIAINRFRWP